MENRLEQNTNSPEMETDSHQVSPLLVKLTRTNPITPLCIYIPAVIALSWASLTHFKLSYFCWTYTLGLFLWTFIEYAMHRFFYHFEAPANNKFLKTFLMLTHGLHHESPKDKTRLVSITLVSLSYTIGVAIIYYLLFRHSFMPILAGTLTGYVIYDLIHYDVHVANRKNRIMQYLKRYHFAHHYIDNTKAFGVTSPFWDYVFKSRVVYLTKPNLKKPL